MVNRLRALMGIAMALHCGAYAQQPVIFSVDKQSAAMEEILTIHGSELGGGPDETKVWFGSTPAKTRTVTNELLEVYVPSGATFGPIAVTNMISARSGYAPGQFVLNYRGEHGISAAAFSSQTDFQAQSGLYDLCLGDFNGDGKPDIATASNDANIITLFENISTPGTPAFQGHDILLNTKTLHVQCGDLNGDGLQDIVLSESADGERILILANQGNFNFTLQAIQLPGIKVKQLAIADINLDGRPDIVVTNTGGNKLSILPNQSTSSSFSFGTARYVTLSNALSTDALAVSDLNGDGYPEIITSQYQTDSDNKLFIAVNGGAFNFSDVRTISVNKAISSIHVTDLDGDTQPDIAVARLTASDIYVYLNDATTDISFRPPVSFVTETLPVGVDFSDFDGDGKVDVAIGSIAKSVSVLNNITATPGNAAFSPVVKLGTTYINRNLRAADVDGDGKPDIVFTSVDDFSGIPTPASKISVMRNLSCMTPALNPQGPLTICTGNAVRLQATSGGGIQYNWYREGVATPVKSGDDNYLDVTTSGNYKVVAVSSTPSCANASGIVGITVSTPALDLTNAVPNARSNGPVCSGNALNLEVDDVGASEYRWRGPDRFSQTITTTTLGVPSFGVDKAGWYFVDVVTGNCVATTDSVLVSAITVPQFSLLYDGSTDFCVGSTKTLSITPAVSNGFAFQWYERSDGAVDGADLPAYVADASGEFYAVITPDNSGCAPQTTAVVALRALEPPVADFEAPALSCTGNETEFLQQSTGNPAVQWVYQWTFGDGQSSNEENPTTAFVTPGTYDVTLSVSYQNLGNCSAMVTKPIDVVAPVSALIDASATAICPGDEATLSVSGTFASTVWSTGETTAETVATAPGIYHLTVIDENGCTSEAEISIAKKDMPVLVVSSDRDAIAAGQWAQLSASGADEYSWSPGKTLNDSTLSDPVASPLESVTYTVTGALADGCSATATIDILVSGEVVNIRVPVLFSPNGDEVNPVLVIEGVENYPDCSFNVFDRRGRKVFGTIGYENNWDGTMGGTPLPQGVYYYVFGCPNRKVNTGTVTIVR